MKNVENVLTKKGVTEDYVILHRSLARDVREDIINITEFTVYTWLKCNANPYAKVTTSTSNLNHDIFLGKVTDGYVNKILSSLNKKNYIYYRERKGRKGSFEIMIDKFLLPTKDLTNVQNKKESESAKIEDILINNECEEVSPMSAPMGPMSEGQIDIDNQSFQEVNLSELVRGNNNNNDNYKDTDKDTNNNRSEYTSQEEKYILVSTFLPVTEEEKTCHLIAQEIEEVNMNYLLSVKDKYGIVFLEEVFQNYLKIAETKEIDNKAGFFNSLFSSYLEERINLETGNISY